MRDITSILQNIEEGHGEATESLLPVVYDELRRLAQSKLGAERQDHTLSATALVHEAYLRMVNHQTARQWASRGQFFAAAAEAMRRILIDNARRRASLKRGGDRRRVDLDKVELSNSDPADKLLAVDEALSHLEAEFPAQAKVVKLRYFAGLSIEETARALGISPATANRRWAFARAWLQTEISEPEALSSPEQKISSLFSGRP